MLERGPVITVIDVGWVEVELASGTERHAFAVMVGFGIDAHTNGHWGSGSAISGAMYSRRLLLTAWQQQWSSWAHGLRSLEQSVEQAPLLPRCSCSLRRFSVSWKGSAGCGADSHQG